MPAGKLPNRIVIGNLSPALEAYSKKLTTDFIQKVSIELEMKPAKFADISDADRIFYDERLYEAFRYFLFRISNQGGINKSKTITDVRKYISDLSRACSYYERGELNNFRVKIQECLRKGTHIDWRVIRRELQRIGISKEYADNYRNILFHSAYESAIRALKPEVINLIKAISRIDKASLRPESSFSQNRNDYTHANIPLVDFIQSISEIWSAITGHSAASVSELKGTNSVGARSHYYNFIQRLLADECIPGAARATLTLNLVKDHVYGRIGRRKK